MTTFNDDAGLPAEALGEAPGRGRLSGRRILVVGAGSASFQGESDPPGNGQAIARLAAREGAEIICADINLEAATRTAETIIAGGGTASTLQGDVAEAGICERFIADSGALDGLVCNVGIGLGRFLADTSPEQWDRVMAVNLRAHFLLSRAALPVLPRGGSIVFLGSVAGLKPGTQIPAYDASKAGLLGLNRQVAAEGAQRGIRANILIPGLIDTPLGRQASAGRPSRATTPVPLKRQGTAWEVAYAAIFLLSNEASYITGQQLVVDGGISWT
ncbi:MAG TPA: SDR family NAD(P)-dependent oxidoreductase [Ktedonobacteraceae bacterium]|nr:SDR family NAD(P)-dependent oxidoreductase [Ktedonobacteraceae bacterium]